MLSSIGLLTILLVNALAQDTLVWQEEFDTLDENTWQHFVTGWRGGNHEFQYYRNNRKNSYVKEGVLYITATLTADEYGEDFLYNGELDLTQEGCTDEMNIDGGCYIAANDPYIVNPIQSARLRSINSFSMTYGRVEVRAQLPKGDWLWPAIWMLPTDEVYGTWPRSGEIDIMESKGNELLFCNGEPDGHQKTQSTLHWGPAFDQNAFYRTHWERVNTNNAYGDSFHLYEVKWTNSSITFTVDGEELGTVSPPSGGFWELGEFEGDNLWASGTEMAPFDQKFHFILNLAIGGNFFANDDTCDNGYGDKPWYGEFVPGAAKSFWEAKDRWYNTWETEKSSLKIDFIRVYQE